MKDKVELEGWRKHALDELERVSGLAENLEGPLSVIVTSFAEALKMIVFHLEAQP